MSVMTDERHTRTYEGRSLEEILPRIRQELGPDAIITRQREGLRGGFGGFFQKHFIEVEARPGRRVDLYDEGGSAFPEDGDADPMIEDGLESPAIQHIREQAAPFADLLSQSERELANGDGNGHAELEQDQDEDDPFVEDTPLPRRFVRKAQPSKELAPVEETSLARGVRPSQATAIEQALISSGMSSRLATAIVEETVTHLLPFGLPRDLGRMVRGEIARRIPAQATWSGVGRRIAFVGSGGSGKTLCVARLAAAYASADDLPVVCITLRSRDRGAELENLLAGTGVKVHAVESTREASARVAAQSDEALVVLDTPSVSPQDEEDVAMLAAELRAIGLYEVHMTLPATVSVQAARGIANGLAPLGITRVALTHTDETDHIGGVLELVMRNQRPLSYVSRGTAVSGGLLPADPEILAAQVLP